MFVTHSVSSLATVRSYSSTFQMPVLLSRVAVNTTRASLSSAAAPSLYAALTTSTAAAAAAVPGTQIDRCPPRPFSHCAQFILIIVINITVARVSL